MNNAIYIATSEANSGKSIVALGLMRMLLGKTAKVGYFRPIIDDKKKGKKDNHINTIVTHFDLDLNPEEGYAFTRSEYIHMRNDGKLNEIIEKIIEKYKIIEEKNDFMLVEGTDFSGATMQFVTGNMVSAPWMSMAISTFSLRIISMAPKVTLSIRGPFSRPGHVRFVFLTSKKERSCLSG